MFRSLHMKLVMIMLLLVTSLMAVVGAFLMTSVTNFYIDDFYEQMSEVFGESNAAFVSSLREEAAQEDGAARLQTMLEAYSGTLSIDSRNRNYYILDAKTGEVLASSMVCRRTAPSSCAHSSRSERTKSALDSPNISLICS